MILLFSIGSRNLNAKVDKKRKSIIIGRGKGRDKNVRAFDV